VLPCSERFCTAPCNAVSPAPRRSCTCSLKPPVLPSPSTGGRAEDRDPPVEHGRELLPQLFRDRR